MAEDLSERYKVLSHESVLVVDDSKTIRLVITDFLKDAGLKNVTEAEDGEEAMRAFSEGRPGVVFLDLHMPKVGGDQVANSILEKDPRAKLIIATAEDEDGRVAKDLLRRGVYDYLKKPLKREDLIRVLDRISKESPVLERVRLAVKSEVSLGQALLEYSSAHPPLLANFFNDLSIQFDEIHLFATASSLLRSMEGTGLKRYLLSSAVTAGDDKSVQIPIREPSLVADALSSIVEQDKGGRVLVVLDSVTDFILQLEFETAYATLSQIYTMLAGSKVTAIFTINVDAHESRQLAAIRGLFPKRINLDEGVVVGVT